MKKTLTALLAIVAIAGCGSAPTAKLYGLGEQEVAGSDRSFADAAELADAVQPSLDYECVLEGTDMMGADFAICDDDEYDGSAGLRLSVFLDEAAAEEGALASWGMNRGMGYAVFQNQNWVLSGPEAEVEIARRALVPTS